jgi:hypothetical protein
MKPFMQPKTLDYAYSLSVPSRAVRSVPWGRDGPPGRPFSGTAACPDLLATCPDLSRFLYRDSYIGVPYRSSEIGAPCPRCGRAGSVVAWDFFIPAEKRHKAC